LELAIDNPKWYIYWLLEGAVDNSESLNSLQVRQDETGFQQFLDLSYMQLTGQLLPQYQDTEMKYEFGWTNTLRALLLANMGNLRDAAIALALPSSNTAEITLLRHKRVSVTVQFLPDATKFEVFRLLVATKIKKGMEGGALQEITKAYTLIREQRYSILQRFLYHQVLDLQYQVHLIGSCYPNALATLRSSLVMLQVPLESGKGLQLPKGKVGSRMNVWRGLWAMGTGKCTKALKYFDEALQVCSQAYCQS